MSKQIYDLTLSDLMTFPVWYFPMDETVEDELSICPCTGGTEEVEDFQVIVRTSFKDASGGKYIGYIYWCGTDDVSVCQPVLYFSENRYLAFWAGAMKPEWSEGGDDAIDLSMKIPISFESDEVIGLSKINGLLKGIYFIDEDRGISFVY